MPSMSILSTKKYPLESSSHPLCGPHSPGGAGNSPSPLRLAFPTNPLRLIPNDSSHFAHMMHRRQFPVMSIPPRSGTSLPGPVASYSVDRNTGAKRREQRKLGKGETLNIEYTYAGPTVQVCHSAPLRVFSCAATVIDGHGGYPFTPLPCARRRALVLL